MDGKYDESSEAFNLCESCGFSWCECGIEKTVKPEEMNDLEKAQIILQIFMVKFNCDEEKAKEIINNSTAFPLGMMSAIDMVSVPTLEDIKRMYKK